SPKPRFPAGQPTRETELPGHRFPNSVWEPDDQTRSDFRALGAGLPSPPPAPSRLRPGQASALRPARGSRPFLFGAANQVEYTNVHDAYLSCLVDLPSDRLRRPPHGFEPNRNHTRPGTP